MQQRAISASNRSRDVMPAFSDRSPVGVIGLGLLGEALARRLIGAGFPVRGYDLDPAKNASFESLGGRAANSPAAVAASCDCIVLAVFSTDQVETVVERELLPAPDHISSTLVLCASTCDPDRIAVLGERVVARGMRFLETPVSGSSGQVSRGEGVGLIGGDRETVLQAEPVLRALFPTYFHVGAIGDGTADEPLHASTGVGVGGVDEGEAHLERALEDALLLALLDRPVAVARQTPGAE